MGGITGAAANGGAIFSIGTNVSENRAVAANAEKKFTSAGAITNTTIGGGAVADGSWILPTALAPGGYTVRATLSAGTAPDTGAALGVDLALTADRFWGRSRVGSGTTTSTLLITIKDFAGNTVISGAIVLTATVP